MEPAVITAVATLFSSIDSWQASTVLLFIFLLPPFLGLVAIWRIAAAVGSLKDEIREQQVEYSRRFEAIVALSEKHFAAFVTKYDNNIYLVTNWEKLSGDLAGIVHLNTQAITRLVDRIDFSRFQVTVEPKQ